MAHRLRFPASWMAAQPNLKNWGYDFFYNIDGSVGVGGANKHGDVVLVQYMLYWWAHWTNEFTNEGKRVSNSPDFNKPSVPVTGTFDALTRAWIYNFQLSYYHQQKDLDGRIEPISAHAGPTARTTMRQLNIEFRFQPSLGLSDYDLKKAPGMVRAAVDSGKT